MSPGVVHVFSNITNLTSRKIYSENNNPNAQNTIGKMNEQVKPTVRQFTQKRKILLKFIKYL